MPRKYDTPILLRCTAAQKRRWEQIAAKSTRTLSQWLRHVADLEADRRGRNRETFDDSGR